MKFNEEKLKLINETKDLIMEFSNEEQLLTCDSRITDVVINNDTNTLTIIDDDLEIEEYTLEDISLRFSFLINSLCDEDTLLNTFVKFAKSDVDNEYKELSKKNKNEYISKIGKIYYAQRRCEEIFKRLEEIEDIATSF